MHHVGPLSAVLAEFTRHNASQAGRVCGGMLWLANTCSTMSPACRQSHYAHVLVAYPCKSCITTVPSKSPAASEVDSMDSRVLRERLNPGRNRWGMGDAATCSTVQTSARTDMDRLLSGTGENMHMFAHRRLPCLHREVGCTTESVLVSSMAWLCAWAKPHASTCVKGLL